MARLLRGGGQVERHVGDEHCGEHQRLEPDQHRGHAGRGGDGAESADDRQRHLPAALAGVHRGPTQAVVERGILEVGERHQRPPRRGSGPARGAPRGAARIRWRSLRSAVAPAATAVTTPRPISWGRRRPGVAARVLDDGGQHRLAEQQLHDHPEPRQHLEHGAEGDVAGRGAPSEPWPRHEPIRAGIWRSRPARPSAPLRSKVGSATGDATDELYAPPHGTPVARRHHDDGGSGRVRTAARGPRPRRHRASSTASSSSSTSTPRATSGSTTSAPASSRCSRTPPRSRPACRHCSRSSTSTSSSSATTWPRCCRRSSTVGSLPLSRLKAAGRASGAARWWERRLLPRTALTLPAVALALRAPGYQRTRSTLEPPRRHAGPSPSSQAAPRHDRIGCKDVVDLATARLPLGRPSASPGSLTLWTLLRRQGSTATS